MTKKDKIGAIRFSRPLAKKASVVVVRDALLRYTVPERGLGDASLRKRA